MNFFSAKFLNSSKAQFGFGDIINGNGHTDFDHHNDQSFINLKYSNSIKNPGTTLFSSEAFERISMKDRMYEKVRRENVIKKKGTGFTVKAGGF